MDFQSDFIDCLRKIGHFPAMTIESMIDREETVQKQRNEIEELKATIERLKQG